MGMRVDVSGCCVVSVAHEVLYVFRLHVGPVEKSGERVSGRVRSKVPLDAGALERGVVEGLTVVVYTDRLAVTVDESCPLALIPVLQMRFDLRMHRHYAIPTGIRLNPACNDPPVDVNVEPCELHHFSDSHTCIDENHDGTSPHVAASRQLFN